MLSKVSDSKVHGINMGPIWGRQDPGGPHVGPMNFAIWGSKGGYRSQPLWKKYKVIAICYFNLTCFINCPLADTSTNWQSLYNDSRFPFMGEKVIATLQWRHNERDDVSHHWRINRLLKILFMHRSKKTPKLCVTGLCERNPPVTGGFPS